MPAPMAASINMKTSEMAAQRRTWWPAANVRLAATTSHTAMIITAPLVMRCTNSMVVATDGASGTTVPLHSGQ